MTTQSRVRAAIPAVLVALLLPSCRESPRDSATEPVRVAAAAGLILAFEAVGAEFQRTSGQRAEFSFGSSGLLAKQLREGAPFDLFAAANLEFVDEVVKAGACLEETKTPYARGRITLWSRADGVPAPASLEALLDPRFKRIAIANPEHAPYGRAAKQALERAGVWGAVEPRLVYGENVRQTLQLAETGNAEVAFAALSLVVHDRENPWRLVPEEEHAPIDQALVLCRHGKNRAGAEAFARFLASKRGREIMRLHGFILPGEAEPAP